MKKLHGFEVISEELHLLATDTKKLNLDDDCRVMIPYGSGQGRKRSKSVQVKELAPHADQIQCFTDQEQHWVVLNKAHELYPVLKDIAISYLTSYCNGCAISPEATYSDRNTAPIQLIPFLSLLEVLGEYLLETEN